MNNKLSKNKVKQIIYNSLQESANDGIQVHRIDSVNSIIEIDYEKITNKILKDLAKEKYKIIQE